jgi:biopolymer transport protein ExbB
MLLLLVPLCAFGERGGDEAQLLAQIETLNKELRAQQATLQKAMEERWVVRQRHVETKTGNKESLEQVRQNAERLYADVARAREEVLVREDALRAERVTLDELKGRWEVLVETAREKETEAHDEILTGFPLGQSSRLAALADIQRRYEGKPFSLRQLAELLKLKRRQLSSSTQTALGRHTFVVEENEPVTAQVLRLGEVAAYGALPDGRAYVLTATGMVGPRAFEWQQVTDEALSAAVVGAFPAMLEERRLEGTLPVDVLQNKYSRSLTGGERLTWAARARIFLASGGPVMIPLGLLVLWAVLLIINRAVLYARARSRSYRFINRAVELLGNGDRDGAASLAATGTGILAGILGDCLAHAAWSRESAEKAVKERLLTEVPRLDRHLDTLAVLAAAAPLLGLLGTVTGMIRMFEAITRFGTGDPKLLAGGISEALVTTEVGLSIAIPLLLIHNFLRNRRNRILSDMEMYSMRILNRLWPEK